MKFYEVVIIGSGPAGLFCALHLSENARGIKELNPKILLVEKNSFLGGLGARTDGKLNLSTEIGMDLNELQIKKEFAEKIIDYIDSCFNSEQNFELTGLNEIEINHWNEKLSKEGLVLISARQRHMGTDRTIKVMKNFEKTLIENNVEIWFNKEVVDIKRNNWLFNIIFKDEIVCCRYVVVAPGRSGSYWFRDVANNLGVDWKYGHIDIGLRVEFDAKIFEEITKVIYDPKIKYTTSSHGDKVRTFCTNPRGFVTVEELDGFKLVNGHAFSNKKSENTNLAILQTIGLHAPFADTTMYGRNLAKNVNLLGGNKPLLQRLGDLQRGRRTKYERFYDYGNLEPTISYGNGSTEIKGAVTLGDISMVYSKRLLDNLLEFLSKLDKVFPGIMHPQTLIYAPEIKFYDTVYNTNKFLETNIPNLFVAGDGVGKSRGIVGAALTGVLASLGIISKFKSLSLEELESLV
ncbi:MAG: NAD(P)/FAD-dependent oxidoreductase [Candidatus Woesearchaeota archaeon]